MPIPSAVQGKGCRGAFLASAVDPRSLLPLPLLHLLSKPLLLGHSFLGPGLGRSRIRRCLRRLQTIEYGIDIRRASSSPCAMA